MRPRANAVRPYGAENTEEVRKVSDSNSDAATTHDSLKIPGVNVRLGLSLYEEDMELYLDILRSYTVNVPGELDKLHSLSVETLRDYAINIHSIKGASASIGAKVISERAKEMEMMAKSGDFTGLIPLNDGFIRDVEKLVADILSSL